MVEMCGVEIKKQEDGSMVCRLLCFKEWRKVVKITVIDGEDHVIIDDGAYVVDRYERGGYVYGDVYGKEEEYGQKLLAS